MTVGMELSWGAQRSHKIGHGQLSCCLALVVTSTSITSCVFRSRSSRWYRVQACSSMACPDNKVNRVTAARAELVLVPLHMEVASLNTLRWLSELGNCRKERARTCTIFYKYGIQVPLYWATVGKHLKTKQGAAEILVTPSLAILETLDSCAAPGSHLWSRTCPFGMRPRSGRC